MEVVKGAHAENTPRIFGALIAHFKNKGLTELLAKLGVKSWDFPILETGMLGSLCESPPVFDGRLGWMKYRIKRCYPFSNLPLVLD